MEFCLASVLAMIQKSLLDAMSDEDLLNLLISDMVTSLDIRDKNDQVYYMDKRAVSKIMKRRKNVPLALRRVLPKKPTSVDALAHYFSQCLIPRIIPEGMEDLRTGLFNSIKNYENVPDMVLQEANQCAIKQNDARLIAIAFRYSLAVPNAITSPKMPPDRQVSAVKQDRRHPIRAVGADGGDHLRCMAEVLRAYRSRTGGVEDGSIEDYPQYHEHYRRQKESFFAAEAVRHASRDAFLDEEDPFGDLLDESYDGVIDTWEMVYRDGLDRMEAVLSQAVRISMESNLIARETAWVTVRVKKGLCHILVNERRIDGWLYDNGIKQNV